MPAKVFAPNIFLKAYTYRLELVKAEDARNAIDALLAGKIVYQHQGAVDFLELRRTILANLHADYIGFQKYWTLEPQP